MSGSTTRAAALESRQAMLRVWMAISGVWVVFWLIIAGVVLTATSMRTPLVYDASQFSLIVLTPPLALLAIGTVSRVTVAAFARIVTRRP